MSEETTEFTRRQAERQKETERAAIAFRGDGTISFSMDAMFRGDEILKMQDDAWVGGAIQQRIERALNRSGVSVNCVEFGEILAYAPKICCESGCREHATHRIVSSEKNEAYSCPYHLAVLIQGQVQAEPIRQDARVVDPGKSLRRLFMNYHAL